ncbi:MAG: hypothetical protein WDM86_22480 [Rhizomicrobium sp.]
MAPIFWIIGFLAIGLLMWRASRGNASHGRRRRVAESASELARENYRLRHVLAQLSVENHALKNSPPEYW